MQESVETLVITLCAVLVRWCVSLSGYSGQGKPPMYGDYEAQRHWMEITYNLPVKEWYHNTTNNDLQYWGLDYPPLTAYHSYLCGVMASYINQDWVALNTSRGYESYEHKLFMRYTVLLADLLIYFPAVYAIFSTLKSSSATQESKTKGFLLMLLYPGLIIIDYGHFQYNCISLGFAILAVACLASHYDGLGSILFCLALNYKQMELYHAMPFFCYLLGSCLRDIKSGGFWRLVKIGVVVILMFAACWAPFLYSQESILQVLHRLFPLARGVFEDKVSNVWCALSVVVKLKTVMSQQQIINLCLGTTLVALLPSSLDLLIRPSIEKFKYALVNASLAFFLFSFQVHEKSILIPAIIVCILIPQQPFWCFWFLTISTFSMLPLMIKDGSLVPYIALMGLYSIIYVRCYPLDSKDKCFNSVWADIFVNLIFCISMVGVKVLSLATVIVPAPEHLPDLFPVLISVFSCGHFLLFLIYFHYCQFTVDSNTLQQQQQYQKSSIYDHSKRDMKLDRSNKGKLQKQLKARNKKQQ